MSGDAAEVVLLLPGPKHIQARQVDDHGLLGAAGDHDDGLVVRVSPGPVRNRTSSGR
jgi:hypothetical protein